MTSADNKNTIFFIIVILLFFGLTGLRNDVMAFKSGFSVIEGEAFVREHSPREKVHCGVPQLVHVMPVRLYDLQITDGVTVNLGK
jgi:hypothetical protein